MNTLTTGDNLSNFLLYTTPNEAVKVEVILQNENIWLTQKAIAKLFAVQVAIAEKMRHLSWEYPAIQFPRIWSNNSC